MGFFAKNFSLIFIAIIVILSSCNNKKQTQQIDIDWEEVYKKIEIDNEKKQKLKKAMDEKNVSVLVEIYKSGMDNYEGQPLLIVVTKDYEWDEGVIELIKNGADIYCEDNRQYKFFSYAVQFLKEETLLKIIDDGFDFDRLSPDDIKYCSSYAIYENKPKTLKRLIADDAFFYKLKKDDAFYSHLRFHFSENDTIEILKTLKRRGFELPNDGSLYVHFFSGGVISDYNINLNILEWLLANHFSTALSYEQARELTTRYEVQNLSEYIYFELDDIEEREKENVENLDSYDINRKEDLKKLLNLMEKYGVKEERIVRNIF